MTKNAMRAGIFHNSDTFLYTARAMGDASEFVKIRHIGNCLKADQDYGQGVAAALGISLEKVK